MPASAFATITTLCVILGCKYKQTVFNIVIFSLAQRFSIISAVLFFGQNIFVNLSIQLQVAINKCFSIIIYNPLSLY